MPDQLDLSTSVSFMYDSALIAGSRAGIACATTRVNMDDTRRSGTDSIRPIARWVKVGPFLTALALVSASTLSGCATVLNNKDPAVKIISDPPAKVYVDGNYYGQTPVQVDMSIHNDHVVVLKRDGYHDRTERITSFVGLGWFILDFMSGIWPIIIDAATGDWNMLETESVHIIMEKIDDSPGEQDESVVVLKDPRIIQKYGRKYVTISIPLRYRAIDVWMTFLDGHGRRVRSPSGNVFYATAQAGEGVPAWDLSGTGFHLAQKVNDTGVCLVTYKDGSQWIHSGDPNC